MSRKVKIPLMLWVALATLLSGVVLVAASGGNPPLWWNNPQGYSSWRQGTATSPPVLVNDYRLTVVITVPNDPIPTAHKLVWMQVEWGSDDPSVIVSDADPPMIQWSDVGCDGPWSPPIPMEPIGPIYLPEPGPELPPYQFGREYSTTIAPQPACESITVTFVDMTPTTPSNSFTIWYNIDVQTLCIDNATHIKNHRLFAISGWPYSLVLPTTVLGGIWLIRRRKG